MAGRGGTDPTKNGPNTHLPPPQLITETPSAPSFTNQNFLGSPHLQFFSFSQAPPCWREGVPAMPVVTGGFEL